MKFNNLNVQIGKNVKLGKNVKIGDNTTIYDNVTIGDNTIICNDCIVGEPINDYYHNENYENPETILGRDSVIRSHTIIYSSVVLGEKFQSGHRVTIREKSVFGKNCKVGTLSDIQGYVTIGDYCLFHSNVHICQHSKIGNFVFIYPYVVFTNDPHPPSVNNNIGVEVGDYTQIAVHSVLLPRTKVGKHCLIGANSTITKNFGDEKLIVGNPAKDICDIQQIKSIDNGEQYYPWPYSYDKGMPWEGMDYELWLKENA